MSKQGTVLKWLKPQKLKPSEPIKKKECPPDKHLMPRVKQNRVAKNNEIDWYCQYCGQSWTEKIIPVHLRKE